jgi:hypothetical protein
MKDWSMEQIDTEQIALIVKRYVDRENIMFRTYPQHDANLMAQELSAYLQGMQEAHIRIDEQWPETWWDAVKERWAPNWFKKRWPIKYKKIHIDEKTYKSVCPHLPTTPEKEHYQYFIHSGKPHYGDVEVEVYESLRKLFDEYPLPPHIQDDIKSLCFRVANIIMDMEDSR